jgi:hypothetical protein
MGSCSAISSKYFISVQELLEHTIMQDKRWVHHHIPEINHTRREWRHDGESS